MICSCFVLVALYGITTGSDNLAFSVWKSSTQRGYEGVLMASIDGAPRGNVCRYVATANGFPDPASARHICERLQFHGLEEVGYTYTKYKFRTEYSSTLFGLECEDTTCTYNASTNCYSTDYYTTISCSCNDTYYAAPGGCLSCPDGSRSHADIVDRCACTAGTQWQDGSCSPCPANTYSADFNAGCAPCPAASRALPGAARCSCLAGWYMEFGECRSCPDGHYSLPGSTTCVSCPAGTKSGPNRAACACPAGTEWNTNNCTVVVEAAAAAPINYVNTALLVLTMVGMLAAGAVLWVQYKRIARNTDNKDVIFTKGEENTYESTVQLTE